MPLDVEPEEKVIKHKEKKTMDARVGSSTWFTQNESPVPNVHVHKQHNPKSLAC